MSRDVWHAVSPWPPDESDEDGNSLGELRSLLNDFAAGITLSVAQDPFKKDGIADMAPNHPTESDVWDFRVREGRGIRCFGCFAAQDAFVALTWEFRDQIGEQFTQQVLDCRAAWDHLFAPYLPHRGSNPNDYFSDAFWPV